MIYIQRLSADLPVPRRESESAAGFDLVASEDATLAPGERAVIPTGFAWEIPEGCVGRVSPRSGLAVRHGVDVLAGVVDSDYRGEVKVVLINHGAENFTVNRGDRIAQMLIQYLHPSPPLKIVDDLTPTKRGEGGFGHTGV
jgi:dUTP pyrophosphatase